MQNIDIKNIITRSKLVSFLKGDEGYSIKNMHADMPTDNTQVVEYLKNYYLQTKDVSVWLEFEKGLITISGEKEFIFLVPLYIHSYLHTAKELNFYPVNMSNIKQAFSKYIIEYKSYLQENQNWIGANMNGGLLGHMNYMINLIGNQFGVFISEAEDSNI